MTEPTKIIIADTIGNHLTEAYRALLPDVPMFGHSHPDEPSVNYPPHNHGAWCGWLAGVPCQTVAREHGRKFELHFVSVFRPNATAYPDGMQFLMDKIAEIRPHVVSRSFGSWDRDNQFTDMMLREFFNEWSPQWFALQDDIGFIDIAAAGNSDEMDADNDVSSPQKYMPDRSVIVGSCRRDGTPSDFSGDGQGVACLMWGDRIISPGLAGDWHLWRGTSAACPKLAGVAAVQVDTRDELRDLIHQEATFPTGAQRPHPKWGYGTCEHLWQRFYDAHHAPGPHTALQTVTEIY